LSRFLRRHRAAGDHQTAAVKRAEKIKEQRSTMMKSRDASVGDDDLDDIGAMRMRSTLG